MFILTLFCVESKKIVLSDFDIEDFFLCAIHANIPPYKMAFLLNKKLDLQLKRTHDDVIITNQDKELEGIYSKYVFEDDTCSITYTLIENKSVIKGVNFSKTKDLFPLEVPLQKTTKLIPEYGVADFFLKVETEYDNYNIKLLVSNILEIKHIATSYEVDYDKIKRKTNLIFE